MRGNSLARFTTGLLSLHLFAGCLGEASAQRRSGSSTLPPATAARLATIAESLPDPAGGGNGSGTRLEPGLVFTRVYRGVTFDGLQEDGVFESFEQAYRTPEKVRRLAVQTADLGMKQLPPGLGSLVNLEALELACLENLEALPEEIGRLRKLQELIIDNGNGCSMNISLPRSIGQLENLRVLRLYGALDGRDIGAEESARTARSRALPDTLANLQKLEELDLGRNGLAALPPQVGSLRGLKKLGLDYNDIRVLPAFVGNLTSLEELSLRSNGGVRLPQSLARVKGLKVYMGNNRLTLREQKSLRARFPGIVFFFENEYDDDAVNQEPARPKGRRGRRR